MLLLDIKDGKLWLKRHIGDGKYEFLSEAEMLDYNKRQRDAAEALAAKIYDDAFKS